MPPRGPAGQIRLLRDQNFRLLWLGQVCSQLGDRLTQLLLVALVAERAGGSSLTLAKVMTVTSLPALLLSPVAGVFVDRWDRKRTMIVCDLIRAAAILTLPWAGRLESRFLLYVDVFLLFAVATFFVPARLALIPDLVPSGHLAKANALFTSSGMIGSTFILLLGALLVEWAGVVRGSWVNAAGFLASAAFILPIVPRTRRQAAAEESPRKIWVEVWEGIRQLWRKPATRFVVGLLALLMTGAGASLVVGTTLVQKSLGSVTKDLGFVSLWAGIGMLLGTLAHGRWGTHRRKRLVLGGAFIGCALALCGFVVAVGQMRSGVAASVAGLFLGFCVAPVGVVANTLVHQAHPERLHGRIFSSLGIVVNLGFIGSMLAGGWLGERWGEARLLAALAAAFALCGAALLYYKDNRSGKKETAS